MASAKKKIPNRLLVQDQNNKYLSNMPSMNQDQYPAPNNKNSFQSSSPMRRLNLSPGSPGQLPDNIELQKIWNNYQQMQMMNQKEDAEAEDLNEDLMVKPKRNRGLATLINKKKEKRRDLVDEEKKADADELKEAGTEDKEEKANADNDNYADEVRDNYDDDIVDNKTHADDDVDAYIERFLKRAESINDKVDHLLFHSGHDLAGVTAHYTPYGIQMLPSQKNSTSVDQKLKMIDFMHNLGGGYNPMLHTMLPYYLGQHRKDISSIKYDQFENMKIADNEQNIPKLL